MFSNDYIYNLASLLLFIIKIMRDFFGMGWTEEKKHLISWEISQLRSN